MHLFLDYLLFWKCHRLTYFHWLRLSWLKHFWDIRMYWRHAMVGKVSAGCGFQLARRLYVYIQCSANGLELEAFDAWHGWRYITESMCAFYFSDCIFVFVGFSSLTYLWHIHATPVVLLLLLYRPLFRTPTNFMDPIVYARYCLDSCHIFWVS